MARAALAFPVIFLLGKPCPVGGWGSSINPELFFQTQSLAPHSPFIFTRSWSDPAARKSHTLSRPFKEIQQKLQELVLGNKLEARQIWSSAWNTTSLPYIKAVFDAQGAEAIGNFFKRLVVPFPPTHSVEFPQWVTSKPARIYILTEFHRAKLGIEGSANDMGIFADDASIIMHEFGAFMALPHEANVALQLLYDWRDRAPMPPPVDAAGRPTRRRSLEMDFAEEYARRLAIDGMSSSMPFRKVIRLSLAYIEDHITEYARSETPRDQMSELHEFLRTLKAQIPSLTPEAMQAAIRKFIKNNIQPHVKTAPMRHPQLLSWMRNLEMEIPTKPLSKNYQGRLKTSLHLHRTNATAQHTPFYSGPEIFSFIRLRRESGLPPKTEFSSKLNLNTSNMDDFLLHLPQIISWLEIQAIAGHAQRVVIRWNVDSQSQPLQITADFQRKDPNLKRFNRPHAWSIRVEPDEDEYSLPRQSFSHLKSRPDIEDPDFPRKRNAWVFSRDEILRRDEPWHERVYPSSRALQHAS